MNGKFERVGSAPGSALANTYTGRGLAVGDLDGDGRLDLVLNNIDSKPAILRNVSNSKAHWLDVRLVGDPAAKSPKDAVGSIVFVTTGKLRQRADLVSGAVYCSQNDLVLHFGLGSASKIDKLEVQWPNGDVDVFPVPGVDRTVTLVQGKSGKQ
jgi:hypothetical protein